MRLSEFNVKKIFYDASYTKTVFLYFYKENDECEIYTQALSKVIKDDNACVNLVLANLDDAISQGIAMQLEVKSVPCLFIFQKGEVIDKFFNNEILDNLNKIIKRHNLA